jgi:PAS domain S-box-containing protein
MEQRTWLSAEEGPDVGPQIIFGMDPTGRCTLSVGSGLAALGFRPGEMVGTDLLEFYRDDPLGTEALTRALAGEAFHAEREYIGRRLSLYFEPVFDEGGALSGALGVATDVTEQRQLEREARAARRRAYHLAELSTVLTREVLDLPALLKVVVRAVTEVAGPAGVLWLRSADGQRLVPAAAWDGSRAEREIATILTSEEHDAASYTPEVAGAAALVAPTVLDPDARMKATAPGGPLARLAASGTGGAVLRVPLHSRGQLVGLVDVARTEAAGPFRDEDIDLVADIAGRSALAVDNALLLQAHRLAREELVKFQALADASDNLIGISDTADRLVYLNPRVADIGLTADGQDAWSVLTTYIGQEPTQAIRAQLATAGRWSGQLPLSVVRQDGAAAERIVDMEVFRLHHPDTSADLGTAWIASDITELRATEAALRLANADLGRFNALVEASPDFIAIAGLDGAVQYVNPGGRALIGLGADVDVTTTTISDYLTPEGLAASLVVEQPAVLREGHWEGESTLRSHSGGPPIPVAIASFLMRDIRTGEPFALATVQRDITERRAAETALRELAEQREALLTRLVDAQDAERVRIAADVHDDTVQACAAVDLRLGLLRRRVRERAPELLEELEGMQASVTGATERLRALLFDLEPPDLSGGLAPALARAAEEVFEGAAVRCTVDGDQEPAMPEATRAMAYRIAKEALVNVLKHSRAATVAVSVTGAGGGLEVTVHDDGVGPGAAVNGSTPGHRGIAGMQDRATLAGGRCDVGESPQGGTCVTLWLPGPGRQ